MFSFLVVYSDPTSDLRESVEESGRDTPVVVQGHMIMESLRQDRCTCQRVTLNRQLYRV